MTEPRVRHYENMEKVYAGINFNRSRLIKKRAKALVPFPNSYPPVAATMKHTENFSKKSSSAGDL